MVTALAASQSAEDGLPVTPSYVAEKGVASTVVLVADVGPSVVSEEGAATGGIEVGVGDKATGEACGASVITPTVGRDVVATGGCTGAATGATLIILAVGSDVFIWNTGCWMGADTGNSPLVGDTKGCGDTGDWTIVGDSTTGCRTAGEMVGDTVVTLGDCIVGVCIGLKAEGASIAVGRTVFDASDGDCVTPFEFLLLEGLGASDSQPAFDPLPPPFPLEPVSWQLADDLLPPFPLPPLPLLPLLLLLVELDQLFDGAGETDGETASL